MQAVVMLSGVLVSSSFLEIVTLPNGEIALQRADEEGEPLVNISFSDVAKAYIGEESCLDVAKVMIQAGIQAAAHITGAELRDEKGLLDEDEIEETVVQILH
jgi:hypothetical protein